MLSHSRIALNTTASLDKYLVPNVWTLKNVKTNLDTSLWSERTPNTRILNLIYSRETTIESLAWSKVSQWVMKQISASFCNESDESACYWSENFGREENLSPVLLPAKSWAMDEQFKLGIKVVDVVDRANRKKCVTLLRYNLGKPGSSYAQVQFSASKKEDDKFQPIVYAKSTHQQFICLKWCNDFFIRQNFYH